MYDIIFISESQLIIGDNIIENKVKDIIIKALEESGYEVKIDNGTLIVDDYDTNNGVSVKVETIPRTEFVTL